MTDITLVHRTMPFATWMNTVLKDEGIKDIKNEMTYFEIKSATRLYEIATKSLAKHATQSFVISQKESTSPATRILENLARIARAGTGKVKELTQEEKEEQESVTNLTLGLGLHSMEFNNEKIWILHQTISKPEAGFRNKEPVFKHSLVLLIKGIKKEKILRELCDKIVSDSEKQKDSLFFEIYRWEAEDQYWSWSGKKIARDLKTIILPQITKDSIVNDISKFLEEKSIQWYFTHGIPYKRSYLFYGVPGSGKSSLIQGLAAKFERNLCFLQPTHPKMTDNSFKSCIEEAPANSLIVLEDIDALFHKDRSKKHKDCPLTFSGLLNGLDGVGNPDGQIFILTTNFIDQLDEALIRSGRVDLHIEFPLATDEQLKLMFNLFYPENSELTETFAIEIRKVFTEGVSMATVQQHFITMMFKPAIEVVNTVKDIKNRMNTINELNEQTKIKEKNDDQENDKDEENKEKEESDKEDSSNKESEKEKGKEENNKKTDNKNEKTEDTNKDKKVTKTENKAKPKTATAATAAVAAKKDSKAVKTDDSKKTDAKKKETTTKNNDKSKK